MEYFVETHAGRVFKFDYPCYGMLAEMHALGQSHWASDIEEWEDDSFDYVRDSGVYDPAPREGLLPSDVKAVYTIIHHDNHWDDAILETKLFQHIDVVGGDHAPWLDTSCKYLRLNFQEVPCDELFIPMFMLRNIFSDGDEAEDVLFAKLLNKGYDLFTSVVVANTFYESTQYDWGKKSHKRVWYLNQEDGGIFHNAKVGDFVQILKGESPEYQSSVWGSLERGYPVDGWKVDRYPDGGDPEKDNKFTGSPHHMSDCMRVKADYKDKFLSTYMHHYSSIHSEEEFNSFIEQVMKHVNKS